MFDEVPDCQNGAWWAVAAERKGDILGLGVHTSVVVGMLESPTTVGH